MPSSGSGSPASSRSSVDLPAPFAPTSPTDVAGGDDQVETGEQDAGAVAGGEAGGLEGG